MTRTPSSQGQRAEEEATGPDVLPGRPGGRLQEDEATKVGRNSAVISAAVGMMCRDRNIWPNETDVSVFC